MVEALFFEKMESWYDLHGTVEIRERAVRLVREHRDEYRSEWAAICSIAEKFRVSGETLRNRMRQAKVDGGQRPGTTTEESAELTRLRRENA